MMTSPLGCDWEWEIFARKWGEARGMGKYTNNVLKKLIFPNDLKKEKIIFLVSNIFRFVPNRFALLPIFL